MDFKDPKINENFPNLDNLRLQSGTRLDSGQ